MGKLHVHLKAEQEVKFLREFLLGGVGSVLEGGSG